MVKFIYYMLGFILGDLIFFLINSIFMLIFGKIRGYQFLSYDLYCFHFKKQNNKLCFYIGDIQFAATCGMYKPKSTLVDSVLYNLLPAIANIVPWIIFMLISDSFDFTGTMSIIYYAAQGYIILVVINIILCINMIKNCISNKPSAILWRNTHAITESLKWGMRPSEIVFPNMDIPQKKIGINELRYYLFLYYYYLEKFDIDNIKKLIYLFEVNMPNTNTSYYKSYMYEILFYYSYIERNISEAHSYYSLLESDLMNDKDINGRRVYAYYLYFTNKGRDNAFRVAEEGINAFEDYPFKGIALMERDLLNFLINTIKEEN